jgi:hypothetical protein
MISGLIFSYKFYTKLIIEDKSLFYCMHIVSKSEDFELKNYQTLQNTCKKILSHKIQKFHFYNFKQKIMMVF